MMTFQLHITSASTGSSGRWTDCVSITSGPVTEAIERSMTIVAQTLPDGKGEATLHDRVGRLLWMHEPTKFISDPHTHVNLAGIDITE